MKNLKDYKEDIYKCSRCGLCQSVCPVYKATLNECSVSKAKFTMLNGILKGDLSLNSRIKYYMDLCTGCNACKEFCPSGIDAREIFIAVKNEYFNTHNSSLFEKCINSHLLFKCILVSAEAGFSIYRFFCFDKIINKLKNMFLNFGILGKRLLLLNSLSQKNFSYKKSKEIYPKTKKVIYFKGCFNRYLNDETESAVKKILENSNIELIEKDFECCGVSYLNDGNIEKFKESVEQNISKIDCNFDFILTDCASCNWVLKEYVKYSEKAESFSVNIISVIELLKTMKFESEKNIKITAHKPCHEDYDFIEIIKNIKNTEYVESEDFDKCCGFSGKFALKNSEISREISKNKAQKIAQTHASLVLTTCPACMLGLNQGKIELDVEKHYSSPEVMNLFVFLAKYCRSF